MTLDHYQQLFIGPQLLLEQKKDVILIIQIHTRWFYLMTEHLVRLGFNVLPFPSYVLSMETEQLEHVRLYRYYSLISSGPYTSSFTTR